MKFTITRINKQNKLMVSSKTVERFLERIAKDDAKLSVTNFRMSVPLMEADYQYYKGIKEWQHVYPAAEFNKDESGNLVFQKSNGLVMLHFINLMSEQEKDAVKKTVSLLPMTFAAFEGADGRSLIVLVSICNMGLSEEEAFIHIRRNNWGHVTEEKLRQIVGTAYDTHSKDRKTEKSASGRKGRAEILQMIRYLESRYQFRYNTVMKYTEYRPNNSWVGDFRPVDARVQKSMTLDVQIADIHVSIKDVRNFLESDRIRNYSPIESYLYDCLGKWDGKDRIRALARTVPTNNPHWEDWFYTWFLGMVDQWRGMYRRQYGNSTMPLLISKQGYNKSTFCRRLIPTELSWGFSDNMILSEKRQVLQAMSQFLLINLDEFNQISPQVQQGFLKNLLQLPTVKIKPPYGSHVQEFPRLASFIATSNMTDILSDPSGNRRFLGVELTGPIDVSGRLNYEQLYAQAMQALERGEKSYFDAKETAIIMQYNRQFEQISPIKQCFLQVFEPASTPENGEYLMAAAIFDILKQKFGSSLQVSSIQKLGRELQNIEGLKNRRTRFGTEYLVVRK